MIPISFIRNALLLGMISILGACSSLTKPDKPSGAADPALWQKHQQQVSQLDTWDISGKISIRHPQQSGSGALSWHQQHESFDIHVSGPLGQGSVRLTGKPGQVQLTTNQQQLGATSAEQLMQQQLGWSVPIGQLLWWIRGLPSPDSPHQLQLNNDSLAYQIRQSGWQLDYLNYQSGSLGYPLPQRIKAYGPDLELTLFIRQWHD